ncbi:hypothetical protein [Burkholderia sp. ABCPW 14]|uniref:hypothetical protein n=1 Tax=Burkholderia sp. ABCPW 14 TaxID=1637860 RepID=UPI0018D26E81|nr:hypothetical protein [Burkholderia sp. ABCPW 14]
MNCLPQQARQADMKDFFNKNNGLNSIRQMHCAPQNAENRSVGELFGSGWKIKCKAII